MCSALETGSWAVHVHLSQTVSPLAETCLLPSAQQPAVARCRGWQEPPQGAESHPQATAYSTTFTRLGPASAHRLLWPQSVAKMAAAARQAARLLAGPESRNGEPLGPEIQPVPRPAPQGLWAWGSHPNAVEGGEEEGWNFWIGFSIWVKDWSTQSKPSTSPMWGPLHPYYRPVR